MAVFQKTFSLKTREHHEVQDVTDSVHSVLRQSGIEKGICTVFALHATAAITVNENADPNIGTDFLNALKKLVIEHDGWLHDRVDNNAASHIKSALVGPSITLPVEEGRLILGTWQDVFFCELDGPRSRRNIHVTVMGE